MKRKKSEIVDGVEFFQDFSYIDDQKVFEDFVDELLLDERVGIDTEFHRERTYFPSVALVQIAHTKGISLIDPLKVDLRGLSKLLNSQVLIVMHAASQDLEVSSMLVGLSLNAYLTPKWLPGFWECQLHRYLLYMKSSWEF